MTTKQSKSADKDELVKLAGAFGLDAKSATKLIDGKIAVWKENGIEFHLDGGGTPAGIIDDLIHFLTATKPSESVSKRFVQVAGPNGPPPVKPPPSRPGPVGKPPPNGPIGSRPGRGPLPIERSPDNE